MQCYFSLHTRILTVQKEITMKTQVSTFSGKTGYESNSSNSFLVVEKPSYKYPMNLNVNNARMLVPAAGSEQFSSTQSIKGRGNICFYLKPYS